MNNDLTFGEMLIVTLGLPIVVVAIGLIAWPPLHWLLMLVKQWWHYWGLA